jgi:hypothetical protein
MVDAVACRHVRDAHHGAAVAGRTVLRKDFGGAYAFDHAAVRLGVVAAARQASALTIT